MSRPATRLPMVAAGAAALVTVGALLLGGALTPGDVRFLPPSGDQPPGDPPPGARPALTVDDRAALDAAPVVRGADAPAPDPAVTFTDPEAVARAYLVAAHSGTALDAGRTHLRAAPYAVPGTAVADIGVLVLDATPAGTRTATVSRLELIAADRGDRRRGYRAQVEIRDGCGSALLTTDVVLAHQPDRRWLVAAETPADPDLAVGED